MKTPDQKRIFLLHAYFPSMAPVDRAFREIWPEALVCNLLDESLYADISPEGDVPRAVADRIANLLRHCELSGGRRRRLYRLHFRPGYRKGPQRRCHSRFDVR